MALSSHVTGPCNNTGGCCCLSSSTAPAWRGAETGPLAPDAGKARQGGQASEGSTRVSTEPCGDARWTDSNARDGQWMDLMIFLTSLVRRGLGRRVKWEPRETTGIKHSSPGPQLPSTQSPGLEDPSSGKGSWGPAPSARLRRKRPLVEGGCHRAGAEWGHRPAALVTCHKRIFLGPTCTHCI